MPSLLHEGVIALVRDHPAFAASLLRELLRVDVPHFAEARLAEAALNELVPIEYHADAVVLFDDVDGERRPVFGAIFEVQLQRDDRKHYTWPLYATAARARYECPFVVIVVTPEPAVAEWASQPVDLGGWLFRPHVVGPGGIPQVTDRDRARREPQLAVLSVVAHGAGEVQTAVAIGLAAVDAVMSLPAEQRLLYSALIERALSDAARKAMAMDTQVERFFSDAQRQSFDRGRAEGRTEGEAKGRTEGEAKGRTEGEAKGRAEGEAKALLMILRRRGLAITNDQQQRILACTDVATLDRWLDRAFSVASSDELFA